MISAYYLWVRDNRAIEEMGRVNRETPVITIQTSHRDLHAIGASMISLPKTLRISRGIAAYKPHSALKSGVLKGREKSP